jgi:serine/threonine protein phosphatase PrpC
MVKTALKFSGRTDPGRVRRNNEDAFHVDADRGIFLVVDGIGGQAAGEKAAAIAVERLRARLERQTGATEQRIREAIAIANNEIFKAARANPEWEGMACVLTVVVLENGAVFENGAAVVGHVGDSRLYLLRRGEIRKVTHDHSPVGEREDKGEIGETEAMRHPRRNEVFRDVGSEEHEPDDANFIEIQRIPFDAESALLLCSDGLSDQVPAADIQRALERHAGDPDAAIRELIDAANRAGGKDNVTVVVVEGEQFTPLAAPRASAASSNILVSRPAVFLYGLALALAAAWFARPYFIPLPIVIEPRIVAAGHGARFDTIAAALAEARPNDTIEVLAGEYHEQVNLKSRVTLRSRVPREARLIAPVGGGPAMIAKDVHNTRVAGFLIQGDPQAPLSTGILLDNSSVEIDGVDIEGANVGIEIRGAASPAVSSVVRGNAIHDCIAEGLLITGASSPLVTHNTFQRIKGPAIAARDGAKPELVGNVFERNTTQVPWTAVLELPPDIPADAVREHNFMVDAKPPAHGGKRK